MNDNEQQIRPASMAHRGATSVVQSSLRLLHGSIGFQLTKVPASSVPAHQQMTSHSLKVSSCHHVDYLRCHHCYLRRCQQCEML